MRSQILVNVLIVLSLSCVVSPRITKLLKDLSVVEVLKHGHLLAVEVYKSWNETAAQTVERTLLENTDDVELMKRIVDLGSQIGRLEVQVQSYAQQTVSVLLRELPSRLRLELKLDALSDMMTKVNVASEQLQRYVEYNSASEDGAWRLERHTVEEFAEWAVSHQPDSVLSLMERIHMAVVPSGGEPLGRGILGLLRDVLGDSRNGLCDVHQSPQQLLYNIYSSVAMTDLRGYAMTQFSWMLLRYYNKGNFTLEAHLMRERYKERSAQKIQAVQAAMEFAKRDIYRCDPRDHRQGTTYQQLTRLLQGQIENEVDINEGGGCWQNCAYYKRTETFDCYMDQYCAQQPRCKGTLHDCTFYDSDMWVCPNQESPSHRRYDWVAYEDGTLLGEKKGPCLNGTTKVDSWWRYLFWHCSYCLCLCDQQGPESDRFFSLRPVTADIRNNSVVTGLRLVKEGRVIHLQVQQGSLLPWGGVNSSTLGWRPVENHSTLDSKEVHTMTYDQRAVDLDDVVAPPGHVLTGVRFRTRGGHLALEIMTTPLDFPSGLLSSLPEQTIWTGDKVPSRTLLDIPPSDVPTRSLVASVPDSRPGQFVRFGTSDSIADAAQTTVPFLDVQPVAPVPPTLMAGAGLYHKGQPGYAGFVAPKLITYDYSLHMSSIRWP